jgi:hypothetical protein
MPDIRSEDYEKPTDIDPRPEPPPKPGEVDLLPNEARQGITHQNVRTVLALSTLGIVVAFAIVYFAFFA